MNSRSKKDNDLKRVKASVVQCEKVADISEESLKSDFDNWRNDYNKSWQIRFMHDLKCLQRSIALIDDALVQKELALVNEALRTAVFSSSALATTFECMTSDLMDLREVLKDAEIENKSEH
jgi:hypothetical protein